MKKLIVMLISLLFPFSAFGGDLALERFKKGMSVDLG